MIPNKSWLMSTAINLKKTITGLLAAVFFSVIFSCPLTYADAQAGKNSVKIGVLAYRGADYALSMWTPTADYLSAQLPSYSFIIVPLKFEEINHAVQKGEVDLFWRTPPSM